MKYVSKYPFVCCVVFGTLVSVLNAAELPITTNLILRLDGSDVTESGGLVSSWNNQATGTVVSSDFTQSTASAKPTLISDAIAGHAALSFDGAADYLENAADSAWNWDYDSNPDNAARWTTFVVFKTDLVTPNGGNSRQHLLRTGYSDLQEGAGTTANTAVWGSWLYENDYKVHGRNSSVSYVDAVWSDAVETGSWHVVAGRLQNVIDPSITLFVDGVLRASQTNNITRQMNGHTLSRIGCSSAGLIEKFDGMIAEILVYKEALTDDEIYQVNRYLQLKYTPTTTLDDGLVLHCPMDNKYVNRNGVNPPPALTTADGNWTVENWINPATNGTARSDNTSGTVISSEPGVIGESILFSTDIGGNRNVDFGRADAFEAGYGNLSVSLWVKPTALSGTTQIIAGHGNPGSTDVGWQIWSHGTSNPYDINFRCCSYDSDAGKAQVSYTAANGQWCHLVMVLDRFGNKMRVYVNGSTNGVFKSVANWGDSFTAHSIANNYNLFLGIRAGSDYEFKGAIDDFAIWKRALTGDEIAEIYAKGIQGETFVALPPPQGTVILIQ